MKIITKNEHSKSEAGSLTARVSRKCVGLYLDQCRLLWNHLPDSLRNRSFGAAYARYLDRTVRRLSDRKQFVATFFLRNRPELQLVSRLLRDRPLGSRLNVAVLACSKGAEVYSLVWTIRTARPDLEISVQAVDISPEVVEFAKCGVYSLKSGAEVDSDPSHPQESLDSIDRDTSRDQNEWIFQRMSDAEMDALFQVEGNLATVRPYLRQGIHWICGDAGDPGLQAALGPQDIVVANRFLCHMKPEAAADCLRNVSRLVRPGGYLFVSGIDLEVRSQVALEMGWRPVLDLIREIHDGDDSIRRGWPTEYWGLEPFDSQRPDWETRYASVFRVSDAGCIEREGADSFQQVES
jgi:chemotaxis methyl-accepting protein methylase